jgi:hypothetical protein
LGKAPGLPEGILPFFGVIPESDAGVKLGPLF